jgi:predicted secreted hydrolase
MRAAVRFGLLPWTFSDGGDIIVSRADAKCGTGFQPANTQQNVVTRAVARPCNVLLAVLLSACAACCPGAFYEILSANPIPAFPRDEAPHCVGAEWWYYTGVLATTDGDRYGIEAVVFHAPRGLFLLPIDAWVAHFAVLDESSGDFAYEQDRWLGTQPATVEGFDLFTPLVQMTGFNGHDALHAATSDGRYVLDLALDDIKGVVLHGGDGYVPYGSQDMSFYYSRPRMQASGTLQIRGAAEGVSGTLWFDRQWGRDLTDPLIAWDWFSLRLDNGVDVMLFVFRDSDPPVVLGTFMSAAGDPVHLNAADVVITPTDWWTSPHTGRTYPVRWEIRIIGQELSLEVAAVVDDQELDVRGTTLNVYWEGLCRLAGTHHGQPVQGVAYVELTNYP